MATINPTIARLGGDDSVLKYTFAALTTTNTVGASVESVQWADRSVQILGTFGTNGSVTIQGSNDGGTTWAALTDPQGNAITKTAAAIEQVSEITGHIRPTVTAGDGDTSLTVVIISRRAQPLRV